LVSGSVLSGSSLPASLHVHRFQRTGILLLEGSEPLAEGVFVDRKYKPRTSFIHDHGEIVGWAASAPDGTDCKCSGRGEGESPRGGGSGCSSGNGNGCVFIRRGRYEKREGIAYIDQSGGSAGRGRENKRCKCCLPDEIKLPAHVRDRPGAVADVG